MEVFVRPFGRDNAETSHIPSMTEQEKKMHGGFVLRYITNWNGKMVELKLGERDMVRGNYVTPWCSYYL
ncbi:unnamed protein product [Linum tenue]|uniref:Uncharacterized protein n=1 Tax=Linum tenue TaxID=586396 RepID=A0AAV0L8V9_9ROSI|nr:unnamed protein product [Linum tenue]